MKKKLIVNMSKLSIGGMEKALVDLLNMSNLTKNYDVELLVVYNTSNNYIDLLPKNIKLNILYKGIWGLKGKLIAAIKLIFKLIFTKKYDVSICYTHHHKILSKLTRKQSKNNIIFIHADLPASRTKKELKKLCNDLQFDKFKKIICVSECVKNSMKKLYPYYDGLIEVANNYIDEKMILSKSKEKITLKKSEIITFINVSRHEEETKKISRILKATERLNKEEYKFQVLLVGEGEDTISYKEYVNKNNINNVKFLGAKVNPFPYYKLADAYVFSSQYEGYGIVLNEARVLSIPIITTDVADAKIITKEGYGILCDNSDDGIYSGMKEFLDKGFAIQKQFKAELFNEKITKTIDEIIAKQV